MKKNLTQREQLFCLYYSCLQDGEEAARRAGYRGENPALVAAHLLQRKEIRQCLASLSPGPELLYQAVLRGYERLAFGSVADALHLALLEHPEEASPQGLDLFCISKISRGKDGRLEFAFYDRLQALQALQELLEREEHQQTDGFYEAIRLGAQALNRMDGENG